MKFKFIKCPIEPGPVRQGRKHTLLPIISVGVFNKANTARGTYLRAMIDSGAGCSIFPAALGEAIGLTIENGNKIPITGIEQSTFEGYLHEIILEVGGWQFDSIACFCRRDIAFPVLGREGFFSLFAVIIDFCKEEIELKERVKPVRAGYH